MVRVRSTAKIPLKTFMNRGSYEQRFAYALDLNKQFFEKFRDGMKDNQVDCDEYERILKNILPENVRVRLKTYVKKLINMENPCVSTLANDFGDIIALEMRIPCRKLSDGKRVIDQCDANDFMHENFHLFTTLANPKHSAREYLSNNEYKFYNYFIYSISPKKFGIVERFKWQKNVQKFLGTRSLEKQINFLQTCRYFLLEESFAYKEGDKYGSTECFYKDFNFDKKIKILEKMLYKTIKNARKNLRSELKNE